MKSPGRFHPVIASYTDPNDPSYSSSATATVQLAPGVPGVVMNKTILSPSGGQLGIGQPVTFNLQVVNVGSTTLPNVSVNDSFPSGKLSYSSASLGPDTIATGLLKLDQSRRVHARPELEYRGNFHHARNRHGYKFCHGQRYLSDKLFVGHVAGQQGGVEREEDFC